MLVDRTVFQHLPSGPQLAAMMGRFQFLVDGWNDDPQELYVIPEVRRFYQHFHKVWPYWFYFCDLRSETLTMMTLGLTWWLWRQSVALDARRSRRN